MTDACDACAELDCLLCFAEVSNAYGYSQPRMSEDNVLIIKQGRYVNYDPHLSVRSYSCCSVIPYKSKL